MRQTVIGLDKSIKVAPTTSELSRNFFHFTATLIRACECYIPLKPQSVPLKLSLKLWDICSIKILYITYKDSKSATLTITTGRQMQRIESFGGRE